ncbi:MAG TPA: D-alanyl-D-alanine carboxypeptidase, partial [Gemmatimonadaceae bacterium]|nr:D-alanyl-D-alanine carboxypeptidase [Gemmatimonadaceae bacterium]
MTTPNDTRRSAARSAAASVLASALAAACAACTVGSGIRTGGPGTAPAPLEQAVAQAPAAGTRAALRAAVDSMVAAPQFRNAHWGILIVNPSTGDTLYSHNAGKLFMPASNQKLLTGAVAMAQLGPDYRWPTTFAARGAVRNGVLEGDLVVEGRGDPTLSDRMRGGDAMAALRDVADSLRAHGVQRITGRIVRGADAFPDANYGFGWAWDDFDEPYSAGVDELFFNEGFSRIVVRGGARSGEPATVATRPSAAYPRLRASVLTIGPVPAGGGLSPEERAVSDANDRLLAQQDSVKLGETKVRVSRDSATGDLVLAGYVVAGDSEVVSIAQRDPGGAYLTALGEALAERGVQVGPLQPPPSPAHAKTSAGARRPATPGAAASEPRPHEGPRADSALFTVLSPPLREVMPAFEKPS